jgi:hypothetical protein
MSKSKKIRKPLSREKYPNLYRVLTCKEGEISSMSKMDKEFLACDISRELQSIASNDYETYLLVLVALGSHFKCRRIAKILHKRTMSSYFTVGCDLASDCEDCSMRWLF